MLGVHLRVAALLVIVVGCSSNPAPEGPAADLHALEAYEGGSNQVEDQQIGFLARFFGRPARPGETLLRGTHAVGTCTAADFEVYDIKASADAPGEYALNCLSCSPGIEGGSAAGVIGALTMSGRQPHQGTNNSGGRSWVTPPGVLPAKDIVVDGA